MQETGSFRRATVDDRGLLNELTLEGVRYWGHDIEFPDVFAGLSATLAADDGPQDHLVFVLEEAGETIAFYDLRDRGDHIELVRMFMKPELIGKGYGRKLWEHSVTAAAASHDRMLIMSDPKAMGFYSAMGATLEKTVEVAPGFNLGVYWYELPTS